MIQSADRGLRRVTKAADAGRHVVHSAALRDLRPAPITTKKQAIDICGSLSKPSKMPCHGFSIPAQACLVGSKLRLIKNSVCSKCYALKGNYQFPCVRDAMDLRLKNLYHPQWVEAMTFLIASTNQPHFRWHDSGDLQSMQHLLNIVSVANNLPDVSFWLPTREKALLMSYERVYGAPPTNLIVRLSAAMIGDDAPQTSWPASTVHKKGQILPDGVHDCPARLQDNQCGDCRACWDPAVRVVSYMEH